MHKGKLTSFAMFLNNYFASDVYSSKCLHATSSKVLFCTIYVDDVTFLLGSVGKMFFHGIFLMPSKLGKIFSKQHFEMLNLFFLKIMFWHFMQIVFIKDNLLELLNLVFWGKKKYHQFVVCWISPDMPCVCKQCRSRSVSFWRSNWSGSALFVIQYLNSYQQPGSSNLIGWKLEVGLAS